MLEKLPDPLLVIGNPPWVTNAQLGTLGSANLPMKTNFQNHRGLDAITGKGNFDIAEWMVHHLIDLLRSRTATLALLMKHSVARKILSHHWQLRTPLARPRVFLFDAKHHFDVSVDAVLLVLEFSGQTSALSCPVSTLDRPEVNLTKIALIDDCLVADSDAYDELRHLKQSVPPPALRWRSGTKHDCTQVMEFSRCGQTLSNGLGERVEIEPDYLYPLLKGSAVAGGGQSDSRYMLVTQKTPGDDTSVLRANAPATWDYLLGHARLLDARGSSIYKKRPRFSVFGIGPYTFTPWKIAICALYKKLAFQLVGPRDGRPVVFDDTVYYLSFDQEITARFVTELLNSSAATSFLSAFIFWDNKRPITVEILNRLSLTALASHLGRNEDLALLHSCKSASTDHLPGPLFGAAV